MNPPILGGIGLRNTSLLSCVVVCFRGLPNYDRTEEATE